MEKLKIDIPILVEGKYDKITLDSVLDARIFLSGGFSVFNNKEKQALLRRIADEKGLLVLTDSDGGGKQIRSFLSGILPKEKIPAFYRLSKLGTIREIKDVMIAGGGTMAYYLAQILEKSNVQVIRFA